MNVLVADDDLAVREALHRALSLEGYEGICAPSCALARVWRR
jgi:DNA-binding response OmpR family regulator